MKVINEISERIKYLEEKLNEAIDKKDMYLMEIVVDEVNKYKEILNYFLRLLNEI